MDEQNFGDDRNILYLHYGRDYTTTCICQNCTHTKNVNVPVCKSFLNTYDLNRTLLSVNWYNHFGKLFGDNYKRNTYAYFPTQPLHS